MTKRCNIYLGAGDKVHIAEFYSQSKVYVTACNLSDFSSRVVETKMPISCKSCLKRNLSKYEGTDEKDTT